MQIKAIRKIASIFTTLISFLILVQCTLPPNILSGINAGKTAIPPVEFSPTGDSETTETKVEIQFFVEIPEISSSQKIYLDILDEVTGLALNSKRFPMEMVDERHYEVNIPFNPGTLIKYRFARDGTPIAVEHNAFGAQVRYRMYYVTNPGEVRDIIAAWNDTPYNGETGRVQGKVADISNNPLQDILISAGGVNAISTTDGNFLLEGLPPGTHNLVAYSIDGRYTPYQQGALIAGNSTTPAPLQLPPTHNINVTFVLTPPENSTDGLPVRLIGNIYSLGNTFANLQGGTSVIASRAPLMTSLPDGRYTITLSLPSGLDLRYKYTLGDGFWNTEHRSDGSFRLRQLIVPENDILIEDQIDSWVVKGFNPIWFEVEVPESTPATDTISIQFNPYTWTEPIPMWRTGKTQWTFALQSPLHLLSNISYRYCRNEQCGIADPAVVVGSLDSFEFSTQDPPTVINDTILHWAWMNLEEEQVKIVGKDVNPRGENFIAGIELLEYYNPNWQSYFPKTFKTIKELGANWVFLTPTWHFSSINPPVLEIIPGIDPFWMDIEQMTHYAKDNELNIALFPHTGITHDMHDWWSIADRDSGWWQTWFDRYRIFLLTYADFAEQNQIDTLVIGEPGLLAALTDGTLPDGSPSNVFNDAEEKWLSIIQEVRSRYSGDLTLAIQDSINLTTYGELINQFDQYYVQISSPLQNEDSDQVDLYASVEEIISAAALPLWESNNKPVIIGIKYPSTPGALTGCIPFEKECNTFEILDQPVLTPINVPIDLDIQMDIYEAFVSIINEKEWVSGFVSQGYFPPVELQDLSSSIHGKQASAILWYWYPRFLLPKE